jgi:FlaG/FlaF family flagellin (archaellin)
MTLRTDTTGASAPIGVILMVGAVVIVAASTSLYVSGSADVEPASPTVSFAYDHDERGAAPDVLRISHVEGDVLRADRVILIASEPVDLGGPDTEPKAPYATTGEKLTEGTDQTGVGDEWGAGEEILVGGAGDLGGVTVRIVWNPTEIDKDGAGGLEPSEVVGEDSYVIGSYTVP